MNINRIGETFKIPSLETTAPAKAKPDKDFMDVLENSLNEYNRTEKEANLGVQDVMMGRKMDVHELMLNLEKANVQLKLMLQVKNKAMAAYNEIKRMSG